jgi:uncharacterized protein (DUF302 family)
VSTAGADVPTTVARLLVALDERGIEVFANFDHAAGARAVGLELADEVVVVFGAPAVGTALMQADPRCGVELPLRMLVWSDGGTTTLGYEDPRRLADRYELETVTETLDRMAGLLAALVRDVTA